MKDEIKKTRTLAASTSLEVVAVHRDRFSNEPVIAAGTHQRQFPDLVATYAMDIVKNAGILSATPDGETSSGHAKMRLLSPDEVADRAVDLAEALVARLQRNGHILSICPHDELEKMDLSE